MKTFLLSLIGVGILSGGLCRAEDIFFKDGLKLSGVEIRRDGQFIMAKSGPEEARPYAINTIKHIVFHDSPAIREAREALQDGDFRTVLDKTLPELPYHKEWREMPGSIWPSIMKMRVQAAAVSTRDGDLKEAIKDWWKTQDTDLENAVALLKQKVNGDSGFLAACKAAAETNRGDLPCAIGYLELGNKAFDAGEWPAAMRAYVSLQIFAPSLRMFHPPALLGAVKVGSAKQQKAQTISFAERLKTEYPKSPQAKMLEKLLEPAKEEK